MKVTNRQFLRNYKAIKEKLMKSEIEEVNIPQKHNMAIKVILVKEESPFALLREKVKKKPITIVRPKEDLF